MWLFCWKYERSSSVHHALLMSALSPRRLLGASKLVKSKKKIKRKCSLSSFDIESSYRQTKSGRLTGQKCASAKLKSPALIEAEILQAKLDPKHPSFIKPLLKSHVSGGFLLRLPASFCAKYLPQEDTFMTLQCQNNRNQYQAKYLAGNAGLSGGWRGCAVSEKFLVGDVLVFYLVSVTKFKVFAIRENNLTEVEGALDLLNSDTHNEQSDSDMSLDSVQHNGWMNQPLPKAARTNLQLHNRSENKSPEVHLRDTTRLQKGDESFPACPGFTNFESFSTYIDELLKDFKLPGDVKMSYYKLCCRQKALLHDHLLEATNHYLIAGAIIETVSIEGALRNCQLSTSSDKFAMWNKTLSSLELLGMNVSFLRDHLLYIQRLAHDEEVAKCRQEYSQLCSENVLAVDEIKRLQATLNEITRVNKTREAEIETLKSQIESQELEFKKQVCAPW